MARFTNRHEDNAPADHHPPAIAPGGGVNPTALGDDVPTTPPPVENPANLWWLNLELDAPPDRNDGSSNIESRNWGERNAVTPTPLQLRKVRERGGRTVELLYRKKLEHSDSRWSANRRLLMTRAERVMEFLSETEAAKVEDGDGEGLTIVGVDGGGNVYENLVMKKWKTLKNPVLIFDWERLVDVNEVEKDDEVQIWGYRENRSTCFAINFKSERDLTKEHASI